MPPPLHSTYILSRSHLFSEFECSQCFFKTSEKETGHEHMLVHHKQEIAVFFRCPGSEASRKNTEKRG